ncbi:putative Bet v I/Major latex protein [Helianthus annuus]|nr:putative Bet v I/Major latex protein [Helianthus annuus]
MTTTSIEVEVASAYPPETVFEMINAFHTLAPKVIPQVFKSIEILDGDGGVGTIRLFTFGDDVPFTSSKFKQDAIDEINFVYNYTFFEGDNLMGILDSINHYVKVIPTDDEGCVFKQTVVYNCKSDEKPSTEFLKFEKELYEKTYKAIEAYAAAHPEAY